MASSLPRHGLIGPVLVRSLVGPAVSIAAAASAASPYKTLRTANNRIVVDGKGKTLVAA